MIGHVNVYRWLTAVSFALFETAHFGWNWSPKSDAEIICDGIAFILFSLAWQRKVS